MTLAKTASVNHMHIN